MKKTLLFFFIFVGFISLVIVRRDVTQILCIGVLVSIFLSLITYLFSVSIIKLLSRKHHSLFSYAFLPTIILGVLLTFRPQLMGIDIYYIPTASMTPTLQVDDLAVCDLWSVNSLKKGDVALFYHPTKKNQVYIKRIESIRTTEGGNIKFFMRGDNSLHSEDSRVFGEINQADFICKATSAISPSINPKKWNIRIL